MERVRQKFDIKMIGIIMLICIIIPIFCIILPKITNFDSSVAIDNMVANDMQNVANNQQYENLGKLSKIATFSTNVSTSSASRKHNVVLALKSLDNVHVKAGQEITFNNIVGKRTEERGYKKALVIFKGSYVEGVGGGVCQVSSTLYNAWLLAGLDVSFAKAHSLPSSYVDLSRDATVSEEIDLVLKNPMDSDIVIKTSHNQDDITIDIYGKKREFQYSLKSELIETIRYGEEIIELDEIGEDEYFVGKDGYRSRLILTVTKGDKVVARREIRRDFYIPQNSVKIVRKSGLV